MAEKCVRVRVPGTSANCGPGFDCLGLACTVYNDLELRLTREPGLSITMTGEGATNIPCDNRNIVWRSAQYLLEKAGKDKEYRGASSTWRTACRSRAASAARRRPSSPD